MDPGRQPTDPAQLVLSQVASIDNLDTARLALRWALERIAALQHSHQAAAAQALIQQSEISALRAREALTRLEAASLQSYLGRLSPVEGVDPAQFDSSVEQQRAAYQTAKMALQLDPSVSALRAIEDLSRQEQRFELWRRMLEGRLLAQSATAQAQEAALELTREINRVAPVRPAADHDANLKEQLAKAQAQLLVLEQQACELRAGVEQATASEQAFRREVEHALMAEATRPNIELPAPSADLPAALARAQQAETELTQARARIEQLKAEGLQTSTELESLRAAAPMPSVSAPMHTVSPEGAPADAELQEMAERLRVVSKGLRRILMAEEEIES